MDWNGVPSSAEDRLNVTVWHDVVEDSPNPLYLPSNIDQPNPAQIVLVSQNIHSLTTNPTITSFTHANIVSATAALITALPSRQRINPSDLVLPASSFNTPYVFCQTLAALYTHTSLAINSVAEPGVDLALATRGVAPTVIIASAETMAGLHAKDTSTARSILQRLGKYTSSQSLAAGQMPDASSLLFRLLAPSKTAIEPGKLRLILTSERLGSGSPALSDTMISELRIATRARICYALSHPQVAGAVAQTHVFDYRIRDDRGTKGYGHFGLPLSSVEIKLVNGKDEEVAGSTPRGEVVVKGPAVAGGEGKAPGEVKLGVQGMFGEDGVLSLV
jgi:acyl-CoA synthetase (AMP-forming)/AMP-acid ligase II